MNTSRTSPARCVTAARLRCGQRCHPRAQRLHRRLSAGRGRLGQKPGQAQRAPSVPLVAHADPGPFQLRHLDQFAVKRETGTDLQQYRPAGDRIASVTVPGLPR